MHYNSRNNYPPEKLESVVTKTEEILSQHRDEFDSIAVTGISGMTVGIPVAMLLGVSCVIVRKNGEDAHSYEHINTRHCGRVVFLDDFICGGSTRDRVAYAVENAGGMIVGNLLYDDPDYGCYFERTDSQVSGYDYSDPYDY